MVRPLAPALLALVAQAPARGGAFVAPPPRFPGGVEQATIAAAKAAPQARQANVDGAATQAPSSTSSLFAGAVLAGAALAAAFGARRRDEALAGCGRQNSRFPTPEWMADIDTKDGPTYTSWIQMRRQARRESGKRQRFYKQSLKLKSAGVWCGYKKFHHWSPNRERHNLYKGPDSHPDNPWFPAASGGIPTQALGGAAAAAPLFAASALRTSSGLLAGGAALSTTMGPSKKRSVFGSGSGVRAGRRGIVLKAHKKAASSTKNQGHVRNPKHRGLTRDARQGCAVKVGTLLAKQIGFKWYPGANVIVGRDYSLIANKGGIVQWRGTKNRKEVYVVPWEYVNTKCEWISSNTLMPKEYAPWMGKPHVSHKAHGEQKQRRLIREHITSMREEWLETEEGKAWAAKKKEKKLKQREIQATIRTRRKYLRNLKEGGVPGAAAAKEEVGASSAGESESEAES